MGTALRTALTCLLLFSFLAFAQTPHPPPVDEPKKQVSTDYTGPSPLRRP